MISSLSLGEKLLISGKLITARDLAHQRIIETLAQGAKLPFVLGDYPLYYCGPTPAQKGFPIGSCGPTTAGRMDAYVPQLFAEGLRVMIGKGERSSLVQEQINQYHGLYLVAIGGAGALYGKACTACKPLAYPELGPEAVYELIVEEFICYVGMINVVKELGG